MTQNTREWLVFWLEITNVRVERIQDISWDDAIREGCKAPKFSTPKKNIEHFHESWDAIYAKKGFGWDANPWVWVVEFKKVDK